VTLRVFTTRRGRQRRIEQLEIKTGQHAVFFQSFSCGCGLDMTGTVRRMMTYDDRFCDAIIAKCPAGHTCEYRASGKGTP
jgi:hypothetical protein